ncbi:MAG: class I SAM-dependent methyltransferase [Caldilineaceae bacterium]
MTNPTKAFRDFEQAGWLQPDVCQTYHGFFANLTTQSVEGLLDVAQVSSGSIVLDVACGAGYVAGTAAARGAKVTGVDFSPTMLKLARQSYPMVRFEEGDAERLPFADESFDAVVNNFGKPHFADPKTATTEALRILKSGGYYAFTVWAAPHKAIAFGAVYQAVVAFGTLHVGLPPLPKSFVLSKPEHCKRCLIQAGFVTPHVVNLPCVLRVSSLDRVFESIASGTVWLAALLKAQSPVALARIKQAVVDKISTFAVDGHYEIPMPALLAYGMKP